MCVFVNFTAYFSTSFSFRRLTTVYNLENLDTYFFSLVNTVVSCFCANYVLTTWYSQCRFY